MFVRVFVVDHEAGGGDLITVLILGSLRRLKQIPNSTVVQSD